MSLARIIDRRDAIMASPEPVIEKLARIDDLVRATAVLALLSNDARVRRLFDELLDLYISLSGDLIAPGTAVPAAHARAHVAVHRRTRRAAQAQARTLHAYLHTA